MADIRRPRLTVDKTVGVADVEAILEAWLSEQPHRDLSTLLSFARQHTTWKTAPNHEVLAFYAPLFARLIERVPTAALPPKITTLGILACHSRKQCNFSGKVDGSGGGTRWQSLHHTSVTKLHNIYDRHPDRCEDET